MTPSTATSDVQAGNQFSYPDCAPNFIGDYSGIAVDANGDTDARGPRTAWL